MLLGRVYYKKNIKWAFYPTGCLKLYPNHEFSWIVCFNSFTFSNSSRSLTLKTLKWMFMRQQLPEGSASEFLHSVSSNQTSQWACGANCCRSVWAEEVIKPHLCMIAASLFGTQQPQSLHLFCSRSLHPLKVGGIFCNPAGYEDPLRIPARLSASESCVLRWLVSTCHGRSQVAVWLPGKARGERLSKQQMVLLATVGPCSGWTPAAFKITFSLLPFAFNSLLFCGG